MEARPLHHHHHHQQQQQQQQHMPPLHNSSPDALQRQLQHSIHAQQQPPPHVVPPLIGQKRDSAGIPHALLQSSGAMEHKLFVGSLSKSATEKEIEEIFAPYGQVDDVYIMRDDQRQSKGCAFVKFPTREMAMAAISALNNVYQMPGCDQPMIVRFADPKRPRPGDTRVGGPGFGGAGLIPRSGMGSRPSLFSGGPFGARGPYWRPGSPGVGQPQVGLLPYGTPNASQGPPHQTFSAQVPSVSNGLRAAPSGTSGPISSATQLHAGVQDQISSSSVLLHASQQPALQRQSQGYEQLQQQQQQHPAAQLSLTTSIQQQQSNHQSQLPPAQAPQQTYSPLQVSEQSSQQQGPYGQFPFAQMSIRPSVQLSASQPQRQQHIPFSEQQAVVSLQTQQIPPMFQMQQAQLPTLQYQAFSYSVQPSPYVQQHQQQVQQQQLLSVQPLSAQLQPLVGQLQQPVAQQQLQQQQQQHLQQQQQQQQQQLTQQSYNQSLQSVQAGQQTFFQATVQAAQTQDSVQPSWHVPLQQHVTSAAVFTSTPATAALAATTVTCNWSEHISPEGHKYYYNSVTGESRWEKPDEFVAYEQQPQPQQQTAIQQQYASSATATQQTLQAFGYGQLQSGSAILDSSRALQQLTPPLQMPSTQQALPSVQDWMRKSKPASS